MAVYTKVKLSGSVDGRCVTTIANASPGSLIHTAAATPILDEIWLWALNLDTTDRKLTIEWGASTGADSIVQTVPAQSGLLLVIPGLLLTNGAIVRGYGVVASNFLINGYVNRIS